MLAIMITDAQSLTEIRETWTGVHKLKAHDRFYPILPGAGVINAASFMPEGFWNLPFLLAYSVLDDVLTVLRDQGVFQCESWMLGKKMEASRNHLPWQDYDLVVAGKDARNDLAHGAVMLPKKECFMYIDAIEVELGAWGVL